MRTEKTRQDKTEAYRSQNNRSMLPLHESNIAVSAEQVRGAVCRGCSYHVTVFAFKGCQGICPQHNAAVQDVNTCIII